MKQVTPASKSSPLPVSLGENPVNNYHARQYACESSPSVLAVIGEATENARDNATEVTLTIDVERYYAEGEELFLVPKKITCEDNGTGLGHAEFLTRFCGAFAESEAHHEIDHAGRNGVGTKTYTSIANKVMVKTTTARPSEGFDSDPYRDAIAKALPQGLALPKDGDADALWRVYEFQLHTRHAHPGLWTKAEPHEMGTVVELSDFLTGTRISFQVLLERLSYNREWLQTSAHQMVLQLSGNVPDAYAKKKRILVRPWTHAKNRWLVESQGRSDLEVTIWDPTSKSEVKVEPAKTLPGMVEFDFRVVGKKDDGQMDKLESPALLLEICGALPYAPSLGTTTSARTLPLLTFLGLEHSSSIGAFCNSVSGFARINSLAIKGALRNNKTTLASGPGSDDVEALRQYLRAILGALHRAWYNATRSSEEQAIGDAVREAQVEVAMAFKGATTNPIKTGTITKGKQAKGATNSPPTRRHRWECGSCSKRWLADAGFTPKICAEEAPGKGKGDGCGSENIGLSKNQPRIADCEIRIDQLGDSRIPAEFQFERRGEDVDVPVTRVNLISPRYVELRGVGSMSKQAQQRLKQYLVDASLTAIAKYYAEKKGTDVLEELGDLYYNRMLRSTGFKQYENLKSKILESTSPAADQQALLSA